MRSMELKLTAPLKSNTYSTTERALALPPNGKPLIRDGEGRTGPFPPRKRTIRPYNNTNLTLINK